MSWIAPKTDWTSEDGVTNDDLNRIEGNTEYLNKRTDAKTLNGYGTDNGSNSVLLSGRKSGTTIGYRSTAEGYNTAATASYAHAEGGNTTASGMNSHAEGDTCSSIGSSSHAQGYHTTSDSGYSFATGKNNKPLTGTASMADNTGDAMVIGNGVTANNRSNAFRATFDGKVYALSAFNSSGADYSEFFEWLDGNPNKEDRVGHFVALDGKKIRYANPEDYIVGIVSGAPAIVGDHPSESWCDRWARDVYGRIQYHDVEVPEQTETITHEDGTTETIMIQPAHTETQPIENPNYDPSKENEYLNRESRPEWDTVGMIGKLVCIDDGTCEVNGFCKPINGIATKSEIGYRVMERIDETHIKVLIK